MGRYLSTIFVLTEFLYIFQDIYSKLCDSKSRYRYVQYYLNPIDDKCKYLTSRTIFDGSSRSSKSSTAINLKADSNAGNSEGRKFKIITPNDIGKMFESSPNSEMLDDDDDDDDDDDEDEFNDSDDSSDIIRIESAVEEESEYSVIDISKYRTLQQPSPVDFKENDIAELVLPTMVSENDIAPSNSKDSQIINELQALYSMSGMSSISEEPAKLIPNQETADEFGYARLDQTLDKVRITVAFLYYYYYFILRFSLFAFCMYSLHSVR